MSRTEEKIKISKQIKRYAKISGVVGGLATKMAGKKYLGLSYDKNKHAMKLTKALGNIKGPLMKVAQLTATIPDILPSEYVKELAELQSNAPPMGWLFVKRRMTKELGNNWHSNFKHFSKEAYKAASLGQVHKAKLNNNSLVATANDSMGTSAMKILVKYDIPRIQLQNEAIEVILKCG